MTNNDQKTDAALVQAVGLNEAGVDAAHVALDVLECALSRDFQNPNWSKNVMTAATNLCAVMDRLRYTIEGGRLQ
jgi:hypothetical protein